MRTQIRFFLCLVAGKLMTGVESTILKLLSHGFWLGGKIP